MIPIQPGTSISHFSPQAINTAVNGPDHEQTLMGPFFASAGRDKTIVVWDANSGSSLFTLKGAEGQLILTHSRKLIYSITFNPKLTHSGVLSRGVALCYGMYADVQLIPMTHNFI